MLLRGIVVSLAVAALGPWALAQQEPSQAAKDEEIAKLVRELDAEEFPTREAATKRLQELGADAIPALVKAVQGQSLEVTARGIEILRKLYEAPATKEAAQAALEEIAKSGNKSAARRAEAVLRPAPEEAVPPAQPALPNGLPRVLPGRIQIQAGVFGGGRRVSIRNENGKKTIEAEEDGKKVKIEEDPAGNIKMEVTETVDGKEKTSKYEAKNADELKKNHPEVHKLYEQYAKGNAIGNIRINLAPGGAIPAIPVIPALPAMPDAAKAKEQIAKAKADLDKALKAIQKLDPAKTSPSDLKELTEQLQAAKKRLEEAEGTLEGK